MPKFSSVIALLLCLLATSVARSQSARLIPAEPRQGQPLTITYDTTAPGAKFTLEDELYAVARFTTAAGDVYASVRLAAVGALLHGAMVVRADASNLAVHFLTLDGAWDEGAYATAILYDAVGKLARGEWLSKIASPRYQELFARELAAYPDEYSAYAMKWRAAEAIVGAKAAKLIAGDLRRLNRTQPETAELLYAIVVGHLLLGEEAKSRAVMTRLLTQFPAAAFAARAIEDYKREVAARDLPPDGLAAIREWHLALLRRAPHSLFARRSVVALEEDRNAPLEVIEMICQSWLADEPGNPQPAFILAQAYQNQYKNYDTAARLIDQSVQGLRAGRLRLFGDINGAQTARLLPQAQLIKGELALRQNKLELALASAAAAMQLTPEEWQPHLLAARASVAAGNEVAAEAAFIAAWQRGSREAEDRLKDRYSVRHGDLAGFGEYLQVHGKTKAAARTMRLPAPEFKATTLDGQMFDPRALQGSVVLLNFWFIACGPCRREMDELNQLVAAFKGQRVVFLAPTPDAAEALRSFLRKMPFAYQVVPRAKALIDQFNISLFPTHVVIDGNGQIEKVLTGGDERQAAELRQVIAHLLEAKPPEPKE